MRVVDGFKAIKIQRQNCKLFAGAGVAKVFFELFFEETTIRQAGQRIMPGYLAGLTFRLLARLDFACQVTIEKETV